MKYENLIRIKRQFKGFFTFFFVAQFLSFIYPNYSLCTVMTNAASFTRGRYKTKNGAKTLYLSD